MWAKSTNDIPVLKHQAKCQLQAFSTFLTGTVIRLIQIPEGGDFMLVFHTVNPRIKRDREDKRCSLPFPPPCYIYNGGYTWETVLHACKSFPTNKPLYRRRVFHLYMAIRSVRYTVCKKEFIAPIIFAEWNTSFLCNRPTALSHPSNANLFIHIISLILNSNENKIMTKS